MYYCIWAETFPEQGWEEFFVETENVLVEMFCTPLTLCEVLSNMK